MKISLDKLKSSLKKGKVETLLQILKTQIQRKNLES